MKELLILLQGMYCRVSLELRGKYTDNWLLWVPLSCSTWGWPQDVCEDVGVPCILPALFASEDWFTLGLALLKGHCFSFGNWGS